MVSSQKGKGSIQKAYFIVKKKTTLGFVHPFSQCLQSPDLHGADVFTGAQCAHCVQQAPRSQAIIAQTAVAGTAKTI